MQIGDSGTGSLEALPLRLPAALAGSIGRLVATTDEAARFAFVNDAYFGILHYVGAVAVATYLHSDRSDTAIERDIVGVLRPSHGHWRSLTQQIVNLRRARPSAFEVGAGEALDAVAEGWESRREGLAAVTEALSDTLHQVYGTHPGNRPTKPATHLVFQRFVELRNKPAHSTSLPAAKVERLRRAMEDALPELCAAFAGVWAMPLVVVQRLVTDADGTFADIMDFGGSQPIARPRSKTLVQTSQPGRAFLRRAGAGFEPLVDMHPLLLATYCRHCDREQVFVLGSEEKESAPRYFSFACGHHRTPPSVIDDLKQRLGRGTSAAISVPAAPPAATAPQAPAPRADEGEPTEVLLKRRLAEATAAAAAETERAATRARERAAQEDAKLISAYGLPARNQKFSGREAEIAAILAMLGSGRKLVLRSAVRGMGGVGKTALAVEVAWRLRELPAAQSPFPDGVVWHRIRQEPLDLALERMASALGLRDRLRGVTGPMLATVFRHEVLGARRILVILDNADRIDELRELLPVLEGVSLLVTSRRELSGFDTVPVGRIDPAAASDIFRSHANLYGSELGAVIDAICAACGHLALAVKLAASVHAETGIPLSELLIQLNARRLDLLKSDDPSVEDRKDRDIRASFDLSIAELSDSERRVFAFGGLFEALPFLASSLVAISGVPASLVDRALHRLRRLSLVETSEGAAQLHPLVTEYAATMLDPEDAGVRQAARVQHYLKRLADDPLVLASREREQVMRALDAIAERGDSEIILKVVNGAEDAVFRAGLVADGIALVRRGLAAAAQTGDHGAWESLCHSLAWHLSALGSGLDEATSLMSTLRRVETRGGGTAYYAGQLGLRVASAQGGGLRMLAQLERDWARELCHYRWGPRLWKGWEACESKLRAGDALGAIELDRQRRDAHPAPEENSTSGRDEWYRWWREDNSGDLRQLRQAIEHVCVQARATGDVATLSAALPAAIDAACRAGAPRVDVDRAFDEFKRILERSREPGAWSAYYEVAAAYFVAEGDDDSAARAYRRYSELLSSRATAADVPTAALQQALAGDDGEAWRLLIGAPEAELRGALDAARRSWLVVAAFVRERLGDAAAAAQHLADYRHAANEAVGGERAATSSEHLVRRLSPEVRAAAAILAPSARPRPNATGFVFGVFAAPQAFVRRDDGARMRWVPDGYALLPGNAKSAFFVPGFYIDDLPHGEPLTLTEPGVSAEQASLIAKRAGCRLPEDYEFFRLSASESLDTLPPSTWSERGWEAMGGSALPIAKPTAAVLDAERGAMIQRVARAAARGTSALSPDQVALILGAVSLSPATRVALCQAASGTLGSASEDLFSRLEEERRIWVPALEDENVSVWLARTDSALRLLSRPASPQPLRGWWTGTGMVAPPRSPWRPRYALLSNAGGDDAKPNYWPVPLPPGEPVPGVGVRLVRRVESEADFVDLSPVGADE